MLENLREDVQQLQHVRKKPQEELEAIRCYKLVHRLVLPLGQHHDYGGHDLDEPRHCSTPRQPSNLVYALHLEARAPPCLAAREPRCPALRPAHRPALQPSASRPAALPSTRPTVLRVAPCCSLRVVPYCSPRVTPYCPARRAIPQPACRALLPRTSHPTASRVAPYCSPHVTPCCPARRALLQPALRALLLCPERALLPCPPRALPCSPRRALPCPAGPPSPTRAADRRGQQRSLPLPDDPTPQQLREWVIQQGSPGGGGFGFMGTAQRRQQRPQSTFSLQWHRDCASQRCIPGCVEAVAPGASEFAAALCAREPTDALGASASTATSPASAEAFHTFTLDSGTSRCFFHDCTTVTPVPVSLSDPTGGPVVARASTVLPCPAVLSGSLSGLHFPAFSTNLLSKAVL
ncbi:unnamed protein product [Closterium sp. NIES-54]